MTHTHIIHMYHFAAIHTHEPLSLTHTHSHTLSLSHTAMLTSHTLELLSLTHTPEPLALSHTYTHTHFLSHTLKSHT